MKDITIHNKANIAAEGKRNSKLCKPVICIETGEVFDSVVEAAEKAGSHAQNLSHHLVGRRSHFIGKHYCYLASVTESLDAIVTRLRETSAMEEDARKWRTYQAEQEAIRLAEEKRLENERKAKEQIASAKAKVERRRAIYERSEAHMQRAKMLLEQAENEYRELLRESDINETESAQ